MGERRESVIERIIHRVEDHIEDWRQQDVARRAEVEANREKMWAEAAERERRMAEAIGEEEKYRENLGEIAEEQRLVFVIHSEEVAESLQSFADDDLRLSKVVPGRGGYGGDTGVKGSWLVFERPE